MKSIPLAVRFTVCAGLVASLPLSLARRSKADSPKVGEAPQQTDPRSEEAWLRHGFSAAQREGIRAAFRAGIERNFIPGGSLLIIHKGEPIFREAFGVADLEMKKPFTIDAPCRIASVTKPHTSTLIAMLVEEKKLAWDDPIDKHLPNFAGVQVRGKGAATRVPRVRELLSHTSGVPGQPGLESGQWKIKTDGTLADAVSDVPPQGLAAEPGTVYAYSGLGYIIAGRIAEIVTGKEFGALMKERLLDPIGAKAATFYPSDELKSQIPTAYERKNEKLVKLDVTRRAELAGTLPNPGGRLISTLDDVGKMLMLHRNRGMVEGKKLIAPESLAELYKPQPATGRVSYGLGFNVQKTGPDGVGVRIRHTGASGTFAQLDFERDLAFVILTQVPQTQTQPFRDRLLKVIGEVFGATE